MAFPSNPTIGEQYTNSKGVTYEYTDKLAWVIVATNNGAVKYTVSDTEPVSPNLGDQWWDTINNVLKTFTSDGEDFSWLIIGGSIGVPVVSETEPAEPYEGLQWYYDGELYVYLVINGIGQWVPVSKSADVSRVVPLQWYYADEKFDFELFNDNPLYTWRDYSDTAVTSLESGDDTIRVASTANIRSDDNYVLVTADGTSLASISILSVLTDTTIRAKETLNFNINPEDGVILSKTSFNIQSRGRAVVQNGDVLFSCPLLALRERHGYVYIRRQSNGVGSFQVSYREHGSTVWIVAPFLGSIPVDGNTTLRDDKFDINAVGILEFRVIFKKDESSEDSYEEIIEHLALVTARQSFENQRIYKPSNVTPASEATGVLATPTLVLSEYVSLYGIAQDGAEFKVATDANMDNLVFSTSSDFVAGWISHSGESETFTDSIFYANEKAIAVTVSGAIRKTANGGKAWTAGASGISTQLNGVTHNKNGRIFIVGHSGLARYSDNEGTTVSSITIPDSFTGNLHGVAAYNSAVIIVGASGRIYRSSNGGTILAVVPPAGSYSGTFNSIALATNGFAIAVGTNGEIQTSSNFGADWTKRNPPGGYNGTYTKVVLTENGIAIAVGSSGAIHKSTDFGATWSAKSPADSYTGQFNGVAIDGEHVVVVGNSGMVQSSNNFGDVFYTRQLAGSVSTAINSVAIQKSTNSAFVLGTSGVVQTALKLEGVVNSFTVPSGADLLSINNIYWWQGRYKDTVGLWSEWSDPTAFSTASDFNYVKQPVNLSPAAGASNVATSGTSLSLSGFVPVGDTDDRLAQIRYEVYSDAGLTNLVYGITDNTGYTGTLPAPATSIVVPDGYLINGNTYWWRAYQVSTAGRESPWSLATSFSVRSVPSQPSIVSPTNGATVNVIPTVVGSTFSGINGAHNATEIHISKNAAFTDKIYNVIKTTTPLTTIPVPAGYLAYSTTYYVRIRYRDVLGLWSAWSATRTFTTLAQPNVNSLFDTRRHTFLANRQGQTMNLGVDLASGGMLWSKILLAAPGSENPRSFILDSVRGTTQAMYSTTNIAQTAFGSSGTLQFTSSGWSKSAVNSSVPFQEGGYRTEVQDPFADATKLFQSWAFKKAPLFFDIITWTGNGNSNGQIVSHDLRCSPGFIMAKAYATTDNWFVSHQYDWARQYRGLSVGTWTSGSIENVTESSFTFKGGLNTSGRAYIAYVWANDQSTNSIIKCGSWTGVGNAAQSINLGFQPQFVLAKRWDGTTYWWTRCYPYETAQQVVTTDSGGAYITSGSCMISMGEKTVLPNLSSAQSTLRINTGGIYVTRHQSSLGNYVDWTVLGQRYVYMAIRKV